MPDFMGLMKQAAEFQAKMEALQQELAQIEVEGNSGGGLVSVKLTAKSELKAVSIDPSLLKPEDAGILVDLLIAAHADARHKAEALLQQRMQQLTGGLPLPPGLKLF
jgi:nucleoid-associated protein EbfC